MLRTRSNDRIEVNEIHGLHEGVPVRFPHECFVDRRNFPAVRADRIALKYFKRMSSVFASNSSSSRALKRIMSRLPQRYVGEIRVLNDVRIFQDIVLGVSGFFERGRLRFLRQVDAFLEQNAGGNRIASSRNAFHNVPQHSALFQLRDASGRALLSSKARNGCVRTAPRRYSRSTQDNFECGHRQARTLVPNIENSR